MSMRTIISALAAILIGAALAIIVGIVWAHYAIADPSSGDGRYRSSAVNTTIYTG